MLLFLQLTSLPFLSGDSSDENFKRKLNVELFFSENQLIYGMQPQRQRQRKRHLKI